MILLHVDDLLTGMIWKRVRYAVSKRSFNCTHTQRISFIWFGLFSSADAKKWTEACCVCAEAEERASTERLEVFLHLWVQTNIKHGKILESVFWFVVLLLVLMFVDCLVHMASFFRAVGKNKKSVFKKLIEKTMIYQILLLWSWRYKLVFHFDLNWLWIDSLKKCNYSNYLRWYIINRISATNTFIY